MSSAGPTGSPGCGELVEDRSRPSQDVMDDMMLEACNHPKPMAGVENDGGSNDSADVIESIADNTKSVLQCIEGILQSIECSKDFQDSFNSDCSNANDELQVTKGSNESNDLLHIEGSNESNDLLHIEGSNQSNELLHIEGSNESNDLLHNVLGNNNNTMSSLQVCKDNSESNDPLQLTIDDDNSKNVLENTESMDKSKSLLKSNSHPNIVMQIIEDILKKIEHCDLIESAQCALDNNIPEDILPNLQSHENSKDILQIIEGSYIKNNFLIAEGNMNPNNVLQNIEGSMNLESMQVIENLLHSIKSNDDDDPSDIVKTIIQDIVQYVDDNSNPSVIFRCVENIVQYVDDNSDSSVIFRCVENIVQYVDDNSDSSMIYQCVENIIQSIENTFHGVEEVFQTNEMDCDSKPSFIITGCYSLCANDYESIEGIGLEENFQWDLANNMEENTEWRVVENAELGASGIMEYAKWNNEESTVDGTKLGSNGVLVDSEWRSKGEVDRNTQWGYEDTEWCPEAGTECRIKSEPMDDTEYDNEDRAFVDESCNVHNSHVNSEHDNESESPMITEQDNKNETPISIKHDNEGQTLVNNEVSNEDKIRVDPEDLIDSKRVVETKNENEGDTVVESVHCDKDGVVNMECDDEDKIIEIGECDNDDCTIEQVIEGTKRNSKNNCAKDIECINEDGVFQVPDDDSEHEYVLDDSECSNSSSSDDNIIEIMECSSNDGTKNISTNGIKRKSEDLYKSIKKIHLDSAESKKLAPFIKERLNISAAAPVFTYEPFEPFFSDILDTFVGLEIKKMRSGISSDTIHELRRACDLLQKSLTLNKEEFAKCQAFELSKQPVLVNGTGHNSALTIKPIISVEPNNAAAPFASNNQNSAGDDGIQIVNVLSRKFEPQLKLPPPGLLQRPALNIRDTVYAMKYNLLDIWDLATITKQLVHNGVTKYEVVFNNCDKKILITKKQIAYVTPSSVRVPFGSRIIALYTPDDKNFKPEMYAGFIAEPLKSTNKYRYLVFFDDGVAQYIEHKNVRIVCESSKQIFEDVAPGVQEFTKKYIEEFPERPMLKLQRSQVTKTERDGSWIVATVVAVDGSLVKLQFLDTKCWEWIYRGSRRLLALNKVLKNAETIRETRPTGRSRRRNISRTTDGDQPYVEYTGLTSAIVIDSDSAEEDAAETNVERKNVARKSTAKLHKPNLNISKKSQIPKRIEGLIEKIPEIAYTPVRYSPHVCGPSCLQKNDISKYEGKNPLSIPMDMDFERNIIRTRRRGININTLIWYRGPCGKMMRNLTEVSKYLFKTKSQLTIDLFCDDANVHIFQYFRTTIEETLWFSADISNGKEAIPIPCVNCLTNESPPFVEYATKPYPGKGVKLNLDKEFLCGCDCTDNCQDRLNCKCQKLTYYAYSNDGSITDIGYYNRRLTEAVITGVYECNSRCSCNANCSNRVVQNNLSVRLQLFKTYLKGWGLRCIDDVAMGTFLCIYAGQLLTDAEADAEGKVIGDEYMAELDHIEVVERMKEGYEENVVIPIDIDIDEHVSNDGADSDVTSSKSSTSSESPLVSCHESDSDFEEPTIKSNLGASNYTTRSAKQTSQKKKSFLDDIEDSEKKEPIEPSKVELPDLKESSDSNFKFFIRPLSPETNERVVKFSVNRTNIGSKHTNAKRLVAPGTMSTPPRSSEEPLQKKHKSVRTLFGEEDCYIMDAKTKGNIGRYLNHSCEPNCFVQCVFTETHDLRFPTVAFFAKENLKAGTELTWDYNYEVGSVPEKTLVCHCGSQKCRGRLL